MEVVTFDGVTYMKAAVVAKKFQYTSDYIGQLCRAKKIDARLVGRTWFVNPDSVTKHQEKKQEKRSNQKFADTASKQKTSRVKVNPVLSNKASKQLRQPVKTQSATRSLAVSYEADEESLLPKIIKPAKTIVTKSKKIIVNPVNSQLLTIKTKAKAKPTTYAAEPLPEVSLSGKIAVKTYETIDKDSENNGISDKESADSTEKLSEKTDLKQAKKSKPVRATRVKNQALSKTVKTTRATARRENTQSVNVRTGEPKKVTLFTRVAPVMILLVAFSFVAFSLLASSVVETSDTQTDTKIMLQLANLKQLFSR